MSIPVKRSDQRRSQRSHLAVEKIQAPLVGVRVVQEQGHGLPVTFRAVSLDFLEPRPAAPDLPRSDRAFEGHSDIGLSEWVRCPRDVGMPGALAEIEVMLAIAQGLRSG